VASAAGCRRDGYWAHRGEHVPPPAGEALPTPAAPPSTAFAATFGRERPALDAGRIVPVVHALGRGAILAAEVAEVRAADEGTVRIARMVREHAVIDGRRLDHAVNAFALSPAPSALEARVRALGDAHAAALRAHPLDGFDADYLDGVIAAHERSAELLAWWLIPAPQPLALRALLGELLHWTRHRLAAAREQRARLAPPMPRIAGPSGAGAPAAGAPGGDAESRLPS
jgi:predicted outer membrane protein